MPLRVASPAADFAALTQNIDGPLFDRAVQGSYPPGSVFKPIVVMAGLRAATVDAFREFECGPTLMIDGREFDNWSKDDQRLVQCARRHHPLLQHLLLSVRHGDAGHAHSLHGA
jgi:cell division protein FtsI/penicillin-binding protein 2